MKVKFCVINHDGQTYVCTIKNKEKEVILLFKRISFSKDISETFHINPYFFKLFLNEITCCENYRHSLTRKIISSPVYIIKIDSAKKEPIDYIWGEIVRQLVWEQIEIDHMFSWLSTLGGAFSALGDYFEDRARIAGKISIRQMFLAHRLGDPNLISRCKLFLSISLIQQLQFKEAQRIIREQYAFAKLTYDSRLKKMCLGIWSKLQYDYKIHKNKESLIAR